MPIRKEIAMAITGSEYGMHVAEVYRKTGKLKVDYVEAGQVYISCSRCGDIWAKPISWMSKKAVDCKRVKCPTCNKREEARILAANANGIKGLGKMYSGMTQYARSMAYDDPRPDSREGRQEAEREYRREIRKEDNAIQIFRVATQMDIRTEKQEQALTRAKRIFEEAIRNLGPQHGRTKGAEEFYARTCQWVKRQVVEHEVPTEERKQEILLQAYWYHVTGRKPPQNNYTIHMGSNEEKWPGKIFIELVYTIDNNCRRVVNGSIDREWVEEFDRLMERDRRRAAWYKARKKTHA